MTAHLLALSVGPVQEFIAAARRTRDLWFGSEMLSEISRAVAVEVSKQGKLIFPAAADAANVANIILAELSEAEPQTVAHRAKEAAKARWRKFADAVFQEHRRDIRADIWGEQVDDVIEFYAAWVGTTPETYLRDRARLMRLLAGRKNCRDFDPTKGRAGVPKSSLDGLRESVLRESSTTRQALRLADGEQLDVVGFVKRRAVGRPYPSVARVAADPWLRGIGPERLAPIIAACRTIPAVERRTPVYRDFPFEGTVVYPKRHRDLVKEGAATDEQIKDLRKALGTIVSEPSPYLAVLVADGDRMGQALSELGSAGEHRDFSRQLAGFATEADTIIEKHLGVLVYAGGDDVLAFVPVDQCLACARALHDSFGTRLHEWSERTGKDLTLSVGVAIAHFMEPLEDLLTYGRAAEKHAKQPDRDGLAVHLLKRGGGPVKVRAGWASNLDQHLTDMATLINVKALSGRVAYDLFRLADVYDNWPPATVNDAIQRDVQRVLSAKRPGGPTDRTSDIRTLIAKRVQDAASLRAFADELLLARQLAAAFREADGQREATE